MHDIRTSLINSVNWLELKVLCRARTDLSYTKLALDATNGRSAGCRWAM